MSEVILSANKLINNCLSLARALPSVSKFYYAMKCNSNNDIIKIISNQNKFGIDVATNGEIDILNSLGIELNCLNSIHTHPIKSIESIDYAISKGVYTFVIDNIDEAMKMVGKKCDVLIRISFPNPNVKVDLSSKFGIHPDKFDMLYTWCISHGINVRGISFHVGSNCPDARMHVRAIQQCKKLMSRYDLATLDIGGGFPCFDQVNIKGNIGAFCRPIEEVLEGVQFEVIAEPGRYIVASAIDMYVEVIGKAVRGDTIWHYVDDGVYGMLSGIIYDHNSYELFAPEERLTNTKVKSTFAGPTCDSIDVIAKDIDFVKLEIGDKILIKNVGAYSNATSSKFNSLPLPEVKVS